MCLNRLGVDLTAKKVHRRTKIAKKTIPAQPAGRAFSRKVDGMKKTLAVNVTFSLHAVLLVS